LARHEHGIALVPTSQAPGRVAGQNNECAVGGVPKVCEIRRSAWRPRRHRAWSKLSFWLVVLGDPPRWSAI